MILFPPLSSIDPKISNIIRSNDDWGYDNLLKYKITENKIILYEKYISVITNREFNTEQEIYPKGYVVYRYKKKGLVYKYNGYELPSFKNKRFIYRYNKNNELTDIYKSYLIFRKNSFENAVDRYDKDFNKKEIFYCYFFKDNLDMFFNFIQNKYSFNNFNNIKNNIIKVINKSINDKYFFSYKNNKEVFIYIYY